MRRSLRAEIVTVVAPKTSVLATAVALVVAATLALAAKPAPVEAQAPLHNCSFCHSLHGGSFQALTDFEIVEDVCLSCHGDAGPAQVDRDGTLVTVPKQEGVHDGALHSSPTTCWDCHDHEGSAGLNIRMIPEVRTRAGDTDVNITFTDDLVQADFTGSEGVCYACHTDPATQDTGFNGHNGPDVCTNCHSHDSGFQGVGGGCTTCHNSQRGSHRPVVPEFDRPSHHIQLGGAAADIPDGDCQVCHDQQGHPRTDSDFVVLIDQNDSTLIQYEAGVDPTSTLTPFCLSCHDATGADVQPTPTQPFSDAITRPEVDVAAWNASTHAANAECADCHEGHGSEKVRLLTPGDVSPDPVTLVQEEEGFCFGCHDGNPGFDVQAQFADPILWVQEAVGLNANPNLNDRHDIQWEAQNVSGARVECVNCHNPHLANASLPYILDPDPGDGHVPGTDYYYYAAQADTLSEFCLDCHDGSFPAGVLDHTAGSPAGLVNIQATWAIDGMGARWSGTGAELEPGTGWDANASDSAGVPGILPCVVCHQPHPVEDRTYSTNNLFAIVDTVYAPNGTTPLAGYFDRVSGQWQKTFDYGFNLIAGTPEENGATFCMACHDRTGMIGSRNCFLSCHRHGDGGRW